MENWFMRSAHHACSECPDLAGGDPDFGDDNQTFGLLEFNRVMRWAIYRWTLYPPVLYFIAAGCINNMQWADVIHLIELFLNGHDPWFPLAVRPIESGL